jgi:hypothetical protein
MSAVDWVFRPGVFLLAIAENYLLVIAFLMTPKMMDSIAAPPRMYTRSMMVSVSLSQVALG